MSERTRRSAAATVLAPIAWAIPIAVLLTGLFFLLNSASLGRGGSEQVAQAYATGALTHAIRGDTTTGFHQFNDCLILAMATDQRYSRTELTVSPSIPMGMSERPCLDLKAGVKVERFFYHNYLHGHTMLVRYLLPSLALEQIRFIYRLAITALLMAGIALCMLRLAQRESVARHMVFLTALVGLSRFFGLEWFGQSLSHAPADFVLIGFVVALASLRPTLSPRTLVILSAVFGSLTMIFEFMTGGLPLGLAAVIGLGWFALRDPSPSKVAAAALAYFTAAVTCLVVKALGVAVVFGPQALLSIASSAAQRVNGALDRGEEFFVWAILEHPGAMAPGLGAMAGAFVILALGFGTWAVWRDRKPEMVLLAASNLPIFGWFLLFQQHTSIHAFFMDRILVWPIISGFSMFLLGLARRDRPASSHASMPATPPVQP